jgi:hypothetical protein
MRAIVARAMLGAAMALAAASAEAAPGFADMATISATLGVNANRLCIGEGLHVTDIGCPSYAPYVTGSGNVGIGTATPSAKLHAAAVSATDKGLIIQGAASQGANLQEWQNSAGTALSTVNAYGHIDLSGADLSPATWNTVLKFNSAVVGTGEVTGGFGNGFIRQNGNGRLLVNYITDNAINSLFGGGVSGDAYRRITLKGDGTWSLGSGSAAPDTVLSRPSANTFRISSDGFTGAGNLVVNGKVGVGGITTLIATLGVSGTISASNAIQVGQSTLSCASSISGSIRYSTASDTLQICTGSGWVSLASGTSSAGVSSMASLTDVTLTNLAGRDYLRYDAGASKWVNISESTVMSTTTIVPGWPDAIRCSLTNPNYGPMIFHLSLAPYTPDGLYHYRLFTSTLYEVNFNSNGTFNSYTNITAADCNASINTLYAAGNAFNEIGSYTRWQDVNNFTYLTANNVGVGVTVSSSAKFEVNGLVSATSAIVYGGATVTGAVSATSVSAINISATTIQVGAGSTCTSAVNGAIRWNSTSNTLQVCNSVGWVSLASGTTGGGGLTGTGSATAVAFWSGSSSLSYDGGFYWDNTDKRLGINTSLAEGGVTIQSSNPNNGSLKIQSSGTNQWNNITFAESGGAHRIAIQKEQDNSLGIWTATGAAGAEVWTRRMVVATSGSVGIGTAGPTVALTVVGEVKVGNSGGACNAARTGAIRYTSGTGIQVCDSAAWTTLAGGSFNHPNHVLIDSSDSSNGSLKIQSSDTGQFNNIYFAESGGANRIGIQKEQNNELGIYMATGAAGAEVWTRPMAVYPGGGVGIGTAYASNLGAKLVVSGTISATNAIQVGQSTLACASNISGSIRYNTISDTIQVCTVSGWVSLASGTTGGGGGGTTDHITSGTTSIHVNTDANTISFTTNGSVANYVDSAGRFVLTGISATTNQISFTTGYFSGDVGIGTTTPNQGKVEVKGGTVCVDTDGDDDATSCITTESDVRLKRNIEVIPRALETVAKLRGVLFDWRWDEIPAIKDYRAIGRDAGVIAQEVERAFPQGMGEDANGYKTVRYDRLVPLLIEAAKELKAANDDLKAENDRFRAELKAANDNARVLRSDVDGLRREFRALRQERHSLHTARNAREEPDGRGAGSGRIRSGTAPLVGVSGDEVCNALHVGQIRLNPATGRLQVCK